ncbi:PAS domain-containing hybrid sensor histidine kinase/response regulator [Tautonia plasticadhaerens]|uniref:histidine kinase n=1 Tax=Tautonia plasticadhaerens TaxID=2527974 RepID=A0A518H781_9BACT|nr:ATP-binding protein [Tautonia plasticadhaerens]QDV36710.1 Autoinducer 2 sensor kinase/phosphatase LuxQ [Tautonia plasticadhaerens]
MSDRHEEIARCLFRESNDALFIFDPRDHRVIDANPAALRLSGFDRKPLLQMKVWDLFRGVEPGVIDQLIEAYQISWFYHSREGLSLNRAVGTPIPVNVTVSRIHTRPDPLGLVVARDISDRKRAQEALDRFFRMAPDLFAIVRPDPDAPRFTRLNPSWEASLGFRPDELVATSAIDVVHHDDRPAAEAAFASLRSGRELNGLELRLRHRDGSHRWLAVNAVLADGLIYLVGRDVTETKRLTALRRAMERTELASRAKSELLRDLGHELRTPLAAILEYAEHLIRAETQPTPPPEGFSRLDALRTVRRNARYLIRLLNDLLDLARLESGTMRIDLAECQVGELLAQVVDLLAAQARARGLVLSLEYRTPIPPTIRTDALRLRQILINLVSNAIKFTQVGSVRVEASLDESSTDRPLLVVDVRDTGVGMGPDVIARLFEPFYRGSAVGADGAGLGLALSQRMAGLLGGRIAVQSEPGRGSRFSLSLPTGPLGTAHRQEKPPDSGFDSAEWSTLEPAPPRPDPPPKPPATVPGAASKAPALASPAAPARPRLLLADDNHDLRRALTLRLRRSGIEVVDVDDGRRVLEEAGRARDDGRPFDLVLLDVRMTGMDGPEAARQLRARGFRMPILALTASEESDPAEEGLFDGRMVKPIDWEVLRGTIQAHVRGGRPSLDTDPGDTVQ